MNDRIHVILSYRSKADAFSSEKFASRGGVTGFTVTKEAGFAAVKHWLQPIRRGSYES
jgi:hypothetical protein